MSSQRIGTGILSADAGIKRNDISGSIFGEMFMRCSFLMIIVLSLSLSPVNAGNEDYSRESLAAGVNRLNEITPMRLDSFTTLKGALLLKNNDIEYRYSIDIVKMIEEAAHIQGISVEKFYSISEQRFGSINEMLDVWSQKTLKPIFTNANCTTPETREWIMNGIDLVHTVYDMEDRFFYQTKVSKESCTSSK